MIRNRTFSFRFGPILALVITAVVAHAISLKNPYYLDDFMILRDNVWLKQGPAPWGWFGTYFMDSFRTFPGFRPILMLSFWANAQLFGLTEISLRSGNLALHIVTGCLLFKLLRTLAPREDQKILSWFAAAIFLIHPAQTIALEMIWKRSEILQTTFILTALWFHCRERSRETYRSWGIALQVALLAGACLSKESGVLLIPIIALVDLIVRKKYDRRLYGGLIVTAVAFYFYRFAHVDAWISANRHFIHERVVHTPWTYFLHTMSVFPKYIELCFLPAPRVIDDPSPPNGLPWIQGLITSVVLAGSVFAAFRFRKRPEIALGLGLFWLPLLVTLAPMMLFFVMDPIRLYLPVAGFAILLVFGLSALLTSRTRLNPAVPLALLLLSYGVHTILTHQRYWVPAKIWHDVVAEYPESDLAWGELGNAMQDSELYPSAAMAFATATKLRPENKTFMIRFFRNMDLSGESIDQALPILEAIDPKNLPIWEVLNLGNLLLRHGRSDRAVELFVHALSRNPSYGPSYVRLAYGLEKTGRPAKAAEYYEKALVRMPGDSFARAGIQRCRLVDRPNFKKN